MKLSAKPISSPGRAEKYPPPLMRFMRTNVGSRSRGRLRSSPMFVRKKSNAAAAVETAQEPSSPKVTCMGQVRVRRSSSKQGGSRPGKRAPTARRRRRCKWIRNAMFCRGKISPKAFGPVWRKWVPFFQVGFCGKREVENEKSEKSEKSQIEEPKFRAENGVSDIEDDEEDEEYQRKARAFVSSSTTPPKNALLLTRCRSAPFRSSSLASRFWGSPVGVEETDGELTTEAQTPAQFTPTEKPTSETESISDPESRFDPKSEEKIEFIKELESSLQLKMAKSADGEDEFGGSSRPLMLTRCKSEPARTAAGKLDPELSFWKIRRLGIVDSCSPDVL